MVEKQAFQNKIIINQKLVVQIGNQNNTLLYIVILKKGIPFEFSRVFTDTAALIEMSDPFFGGEGTFGGAQG